MPQSPGVLAQEALNDKITYVVPEKERKMVEFHKMRLKKAITARNTPDRKFDGLNFIQDFYSNEDSANSYLRPKRNDDEVRVVGGLTEKRIESVVNEIAAMSYQHEIHAFDKDDRDLIGLGDVISDTVTRTNQLEEDEDISHDAVWELVTQRAVFVEEVMEQKQIGEYYSKMPRKRLRSAIEVILGDLTMPSYLLQEQPFLATYDRMSLSTARMFFGHYDNFQYVRGGQSLSNDVYGTDVTFRLGILQEEEVEVIKYMSVPDNEYQIYVNGVPMLFVGSKLPFQYPCPRYPLAVAIPKRMGKHTFYGRPYTAMMKYLQALNDETVRNIVRKMRQAIEPPKAVLANDRMYSRDIFNAGNISYGVNADNLKSLVDHDGVTQGELNVLELVKSLQDEFAARGPTQMGIQDGPRQTATAVIEQQKQAIKMLGQLVINYSHLVREMTKNRIYNLIENLSEPDGKEIDPKGEFRDTFRRFTLKDQPFENGKVGQKIIQFMGRDLTGKEHESITDWEDDEAKNGRNVRLSMVNIKKIKQMPIMWYVTVVSKPKESDDLHRLMFQDKVAQAQGVSQMVGRPLNGERIVEEFQKTWRVKDWFTEVPQVPEQDVLGLQPSGLAQDATQGIGAGAKREALPNPTYKNAVGAV